MTAELWREVERLFHEALQLAPAERQAFVAQISSAEIRAKVQSLLDAQSEESDSKLHAIVREAAQAAPNEPSAGSVVGHFRIVREIGRGGMGVVYLAQDVKLDRPVALKLLPIQFQRDSERLRRFEREGRALAALNHPNIVTVYEVGEWRGQPPFSDRAQRHVQAVRYIATEFVEGETFAQKLSQGPLSITDVAHAGAQIAEALTAAHRAGVVHRDLKPSNIMLRPDGTVKVLDFGLARLSQPIAETDETETQTAIGRVLGTLPYMSPEQARGQIADARSDLWSLGVVLYELLSGQRPFGGNSGADVLAAIVAREPTPLRSVNRAVPVELERLVGGLLVKDREQRRATAAEVAQELNRFSKAGSTQKLSRKWLAASLAVLLGIGGASGWLVYRWSKREWARYEAIPLARTLMDKGDYVGAYNLALKAAGYLPNAPALEHLWPDVSQSASVASEPAGAEVVWKPYGSVGSPWQYLGRTPIRDLRLPAGPIRLRLMAPGYEPFELAYTGPQAQVRLGAASHPDGMVTVPAGTLDEIVAGLGQVSGKLDEYEIDKYEVTNAAYKKFVDAGGYERPEYWTQPFLRNGRTVPWGEAIHDFVDQTGRPGPSMWDSGTYPAAQADYPVGGISWYEAAAYAEFVQKDLPTVHHWIRAANVRPGSSDEARFIVPLSNFESAGPRAVGTSGAVGSFGVYDMGGNVREWCWNAVGEQRFALGGFWADPGYMLARGQAISAWDRSPGNGFRCVRHSNPRLIREKFGGPIPPPLRVDYRQARPVSDAVFEMYRPLWAYEKKPLHPSVDSVDESSDLWRRDRVRFQAPYGDEQIIAYLFLPKQGKPPYQCVFYLGGDDLLRPGSAADVRPQSFILRSGRAMMYPIFKGTLERFGPTPTTAVGLRDGIITWRKDLGASIDYLATRQDIDTNKLAFMGASMGANVSPMLVANEKRIRLLLLLSEGLRPLGWLPETDPVNFLPRVTVPTLLINGRFDSIYPTDTAQEPVLKLLGTPPADKKHVLVATGHGVLAAEVRNSVVREVLDWLDRYFGRP